MPYEFIFQNLLLDNFNFYPITRIHFLKDNACSAAASTEPAVLSAFPPLNKGAIDKKEQNSSPRATAQTDLAAVDKIANRHS
jgi:hypothetical protein